MLSLIDLLMHVCDLITIELQWGVFFWPNFPLCV